jgi:knotted carbamoyltransferase YgeW
MTSIETFGEDGVTLRYVTSNMVKISGLVMECPQREELNGRMDFQEQLHTLDGLDCADLYQDDFLLTWDKSADEMRAVLAVADALRALRENNKSARIFDSGLGISLFRDNSTRTRFSYASACNLLGLEVQDFDEGTSQQAHGETVKETANMISFMADVIGIRDDMYIGKGHTYMTDFAEYLKEGHEAGVLEQRPTLVSLQCDIDHPSQSTADLLHLIHTFGGLDNLRGKKLAMTWAYSPSYGKPLSVPQGMIGLMTRYGMDVTLAHPEGYDVMASTRDIAARNATQSGGSFNVTHSMDEAFEGADIVCPKSWAPFQAMQERTDLYGNGDFDGITALEQRLLLQNAEHKDWATTEAMMAKTKDGKALYMHPLPADITGLSCDEGEVDRSVFDRYRVPLYQQASNKPYAIAAMIFLQKTKDPAAKLHELWDRDLPRWQR